VENSAATLAIRASMVAMTFQDLPKGGAVRLLPLTDETTAADVIDLIIFDEDRAAGCFGMMLCDDQHRGVQPVVVKEVPEDAAMDGVARLLDDVLPLLAETGGSILVARGRPRGRRPSDADRAWHQVTIERCVAHGVRLLGFYLATGDGVHRLPEPLVAAS
jgi:hypothetical protein